MICSQPAVGTASSDASWALWDLALGSCTLRQTGGSGAYFRFYSNGKSIVRVCDALVEVASVHEWRLPREAMLRGAVDMEPMERKFYEARLGEERVRPPPP